MNKVLGMEQCLQSCTRVEIK